MEGMMCRAEKKFLNRPEGPAPSSMDPVANEPTVGLVILVVTILSLGEGDPYVIQLTV